MGQCSLWTTEKCSCSLNRKGFTRDTVHRIVGRAGEWTLLEQQEQHPEAHRSCQQEVFRPPRPALQRRSSHAPSVLTKLSAQPVPRCVASECGTWVSSLRPGKKEDGRRPSASVVVRILGVGTRPCEGAVRFPPQGVCRG